MELMTKFHDWIKVGIELNKENRKTYNKDKYMLSPISYAKDFCTVKMDLGRRMGKTTFIKENMQIGDILIVHNKQRVYDLKYELPSFLTTRVFSVSSLKNISLGFNHENLIETKKNLPNDATIYMDETGYSDTDEDWVYKFFADSSDNNYTYVKLGW